MLRGLHKHVPLYILGMVLPHSEEGCHQVPLGKGKAITGAAPVFYVCS